MNTSRKGFLLGMTALGATMALPKAKADAVAKGPVRLRIGVLSDIHICKPSDLPKFERTLRKFDEWQVDGVLGGSDIADLGISQQLDLAAKAWFNVFPDGRSKRDGRPVANLLHYGDHDMAVWYVDRPAAKALCPDDAQRKASLLYPGDNRKIAWERAFKEPFHQITVKTVKGYTFILSHFNRDEEGNKGGHLVPGLDKVLAEVKVDPSKPYFYSQHRVPFNTSGGAYMDTMQDPSVAKLFAQHPNLIVFNGHCHRTGVDERNIWQGEFTAIQVPSHSYCCTDKGRENGYACSDRPPNAPVKPSKTMREAEGFGSCAQGYLMLVYDDAVVIRRWEFGDDKSLGPDWVIPTASFAMAPADKPFTFAGRAREALKDLPQFASGAKVTVSKFAPGKYRDGTEVPMRTVTFPTGKSPSGLRANDYSVTVEIRQGDCISGRMEKHVYAPGYYHAAELDVRPVYCRFGVDEIPEGWESRFAVRPLDVWGNRGEPIYSDWKIWSKPTV